MRRSESAGIREVPEFGPQEWRKRPRRKFASLAGTTGKPVVERVGVGSCSADRAQFPVMRKRRFAVFGSVRLMAAASPREESRRCSMAQLPFGIGLFSCLKTPNKAPEPTTFAVTARAIVRFTEMKQRNPNRDAARAAPAKVVAHL